MRTPSEIHEAVKAKLEAQLSADGVSTTVGILVKAVNAGEAYVVINTLPTANAKLQKGTININVHSKDTLSGTNYYPKMATIKPITQSVLRAFDNTTHNGIYFFVESVGLEEDEAVHEHYDNIRVKFNVIN